MIDEIKNKVSIIDIARLAGREPDRNNFITSIYKEDKNPSLKLYPETNSFCDFSFGRKSGSVIDFYMDAFNVDLKTAIKELAKIAGIDESNYSNYKDRKPVMIKRNVDQIFRDATVSMSEEEIEIYYERLGMITQDMEFEDEVEWTNENEIYFKRLILSASKDVLKFRIEQNTEIFEYFYRLCRQNGFNKAQNKYLTETRKLDRSVLDRFKIFAVNNYKQISKALKQKFTIESLVRSGLFNTKLIGDEKQHNLIFFNHRIIIPYLYKGKIVYLRGRYFDRNNNFICSGNKYLGLRNDALKVNTPKRFYNIDVIENAVEGEKIYITEGEFDAIAIEQIGYNAIAIPGVGNMPSDSQIEKLKAFTIIITIDNDVAGNELLKALSEKFKKYNIKYLVKQLPTKDPNEFLISA